jgi:hypothetical protein
MSVPQVGTPKQEKDQAVKTWSLAKPRPA